jgi:hypothetical protein
MIWVYLILRFAKIGGIEEAVHRAGRASLSGL